MDPIRFAQQLRYHIPMDNTEAAEKFLKQSFQDNPAFSFNDWEIMYHHSVVVCSFALHLATHFPDADLEVVSVGALLHDIGKASKADEDTLRANHGKMAFEFSEKFLKSLDLDEDQYEALINILKEESDSLENKIIKGLVINKRFKIMFNTLQRRLSLIEQNLEAYSTYVERFLIEKQLYLEMDWA